MTQRERVLALGVLPVAGLVAGGVLLYFLFLVPLRTVQANIAKKKDDVAKKRNDLDDLRQKKVQLAVWEKESLPARPTDPNLGSRLYERELRAMLVKSSFSSDTLTITPRAPDTKSSPTLPGKVRGKKDPIYTTLVFDVQARGDLASLIEFLEAFYKVPLLHRIRHINVLRPQTTTTVRGRRREGDLDITLKIETLILDKAKDRDTLIPSDVKAEILANPSRIYMAMAAKDLFFGPPPPTAANDKPQEPVKPKDPNKVAQYVFLTSISTADYRTEAYLYDRYNNKKTRLRNSAGFDTFKVVDSVGEEQVKGKVVHIDERDLVFKVDEKYYLLHIGTSVGEAMRKAMKPEDLKTMGLEKLAAEAKPMEKVPEKAPEKTAKTPDKTDPKHPDKAAAKTP